MGHVRTRRGRGFAAPTRERGCRCSEDSRPSGPRCRSASGRPRSDGCSRPPLSRRSGTPRSARRPERRPSRYGVAPKVSSPYWPSRGVAASTHSWKPRPPRLRSRADTRQVVEVSAMQWLEPPGFQGLRLNAPRPLRLSSGVQVVVDHVSTAKVEFRPRSSLATTDQVWYLPVRLGEPLVIRPVAAWRGAFQAHGSL